MRAHHNVLGAALRAIARRLHAAVQERALARVRGAARRGTCLRGIGSARGKGVRKVGLQHADVPILVPRQGQPVPRRTHQQPCARQSAHRAAPRAALQPERRAEPVQRLLQEVQHAHNALHPLQPRLLRTEEPHVCMPSSRAPQPSVDRCGASPPPPAPSSAQTSRTDRDPGRRGQGAGLPARQTSARSCTSAVRAALVTLWSAPLCCCPFWARMLPLPRRRRRLGPPPGVPRPGQSQSSTPPPGAPWRRQRARPRGPGPLAAALETLRARAIITVWRQTMSDGGSAARAGPGATQHAPAVSKVCQSIAGSDSRALSAPVQSGGSTAQSVDPPAAAHLPTDFSDEFHGVCSSLSMDADTMHRAWRLIAALVRAAAI